MQSGYNEIPGIYSESPRPLASVRRTIRKYRWCLGVTAFILLIITVAIFISVLIGRSFEDSNPEEKAEASIGTNQTENSSMNTLLSLPWPRRDEIWYERRWKNSHMRRPFETENTTLLESSNTDEPKGFNSRANGNSNTQRWINRIGDERSRKLRRQDDAVNGGQSSRYIFPNGGYSESPSYKRINRAVGATSHQQTSSNSETLPGHENLSDIEDDKDYSEDSDFEDFSQHDLSTFPVDDTFNWNRRASNLPACTLKDIGDAMMQSYQNEKRKKNVEESLMKRNITLRQNTPEFYHQKAFRKTWPRALKMAHQGFRMDHASKHVSNKLKVNREDSTFDLRWIGDLSRSPYCDSFRSKPTCSEGDPYRTADGSCNNFRNPDWGSSFTAFRRAMPPDYGDGIMSPRVSKTGEELPNSREVSIKVHIYKRADSDSYTFLAMTWGQFVDHDITGTAQSKGQNGSSISCCNEQVLQTSSLRHPECFEIIIPEDDSYFRDKNVTCMEFSRSAPAPRCTFGPRQQLNQNTHFLDGSVIYGSSFEQMNNMRNHEKGLMKTQMTIDGRQLLQPSLNPNDSCNTEFQLHWKQYCFVSGDSRVNEHILLTALHTIWTRQHNYIAGELLDINPHWDDEKLFQETRKIVIAQIQHITYHEYLSSVLGPQFTDGMKLKPTFLGKFWHGYNSKIHPGLANGFAGAAFRFGHSMIQGLMQSIDSSGANVKHEQLGKYFFNPFALYDPDTIGDLVRGQVSQRSAAVDAYFTTQVTQKLFQKPGTNRGLDLVAINIQRGRDHGIPSYTRWRMMCGLPRVANFSDLIKDFDEGTLNAISKVYKDVDDIDLYTGGLSEIPIKDGLVGPTFACIIADQFLRLKRGDRFWYENNSPYNSFTKEQLAEIHKTTLARILCNNVEELRSIQPWPLLKFATDNPRLPCSARSIPRMSLVPWEEWNS